MFLVPVNHFPVMPEPACYKCKSTYKVEELSQGIYSCGGICKKMYRVSEEGMDEG